MANVYIDQLLPGMVLNSDVKDQNGRLLLKTGTELKDKHLYILRAWGITEADIAGTTDEAAQAQAKDPVDSERLASAEAALGRIFHESARTHPAMRELFRLCTLRKARAR